MARRPILAPLTALMLMLPAVPAGADAPTMWPSCGDGISSSCWANLQVDGGTPPAGLGLQVTEMDGMVQFQVVWSDGGQAGYELIAGDAPLTADSVVSFDLEMGALDAAIVIGGFEPIGMSLPGAPDVADPGQDRTATLRLRPVPVSFLMGSCTPAGCGDDTTTATFDFEGFIGGAVSAIPQPPQPPQSPQPPAMADGMTPPARGSIFATTAQAFGLPRFAARSVAVDVAAAHLRADGTENVGMYTAFLPMEVLDPWAVGDAPQDVAPDDLQTTSTDSGQTTALNHTITPIDDVTLFGATGILLEIAELHFSAPTVTIAPVALPRLTISGVRGAEGHAGTRAFRFTARLSQATSRTVTVPWSAGNGTAKAGSDFVSARGTLTFLAGARVAVATVRVKGDRVPERNETFTVRLGGPRNATLGTPRATGTILNDDRR